MGLRVLLALVVLSLVAGMAAGQQVPDPDYKPPVPRPAYATGAGPRVALDEGHHNFHTAAGRYQPFADLLRRDGYRVAGLGKAFSADALKGVDVLVIANALNERNATDWSLPTPSAFTRDEVAAVRAWVEGGGSLFLIADHFPFPGAAGDLAKAIGAEFSNGWAVPKAAGRPANIGFAAGSGLAAGAVTRGRSAEEKVTEVVTFAGSAFRAPKGATPVLVFGKDHVSLETKKAREFLADTPAVPIDGWCQGAVWPVGKGRVAVFGEAAMFSAQLSGPKKQPTGMNAPEAKQNHQLLLNVLHWLSRAKGMPD